MKPLFPFLFVVILLTTLTVQNSFAQFTGDFDHANWTITQPTTGTVDASEDDQLTLTGGGGSEGSIGYSIVVNSDLLISFDWDYTTTDSDPGHDPVYYLIDGHYSQLTDGDGDLIQEGTKTIFVAAGSTFEIIQFSNGCCGAGSILISNFSHEPAGEPGGGTICEPDQATEGEIQLTSSENGVWYSVTMPDANKKLVLDLPSSTYVYAYSGSCFDFNYLTYDYGPNAILTGLPPNESLCSTFTITADTLLLPGSFHLLMQSMVTPVTQPSRATSAITKQLPLTIAKQFGTDIQCRNH